MKDAAQKRRFSEVSRWTVDFAGFSLLNRMVIDRLDTDFELRKDRTMRNLISILAVFLLASCSVNPPREAQTNEIFTLASLHGLMLSHRDFSPKHLTQVLLAFQPDVILTEVRPAHPDPVNGSIDGGAEQSLIYAVGSYLRADVIPVDWFPDDLLNRAMKSEASMSRKDAEDLSRLEDAHDQDLRSLSMVELNEPAFQNTARKLDDFRAARGSRENIERNERICGNIQDALKKVSGRRVMIVFGLDHKYAIDECVEKLAGNRLMTDVRWMKAAISAAEPVPQKIKSDAIATLQGSETLLGSRLAKSVYSGAMKEKLEKKVLTYPKWIEAIRAF